MTALMNVLYSATFLLTLLAVTASLVAIARREAMPVGRWIANAAAIAALAGFAARWYVAGHPAIFGTFENTYALAASLLVGATAIGIWRPRLQDIWRWAAPWALAALLYGTRFRSDPVPLTISEQSLWVDVHVAFAWVAFVALLAATTSALLRLAGRKPLGMDIEAADRFITECLMAGFSAFTAMLATGSWYSFIIFGVFWQWSTVETLSLAAWLGYALVIHGRLFYRWSGSLLDIGVVAVLPVLVAAYFIWSVIPDTWHYFDIPLMKPY